MNKKEGIFYKDRYELLKRDYDKEIADHQQTKRKYNELLNEYNKVKKEDAN